MKADVPSLSADFFFFDLHSLPNFLACSLEKRVPRCWACVDRRIKIAGTRSGTFIVMPYCALSFFGSVRGCLRLLELEHHD